MPLVQLVESLDGLELKYQCIHFWTKLWTELLYLWPICHFGISTLKLEGFLLATHLHTYIALNAHMYLLPHTHTHLHTRTQTHSLLHLGPLDNICKYFISIAI